ncbi:unnamed protein product [Miscanthus lutarioriparius]|uniref:Uncharacterized protein n=1 Tax=Miscanthus lutarioriparius TaxID=422564 RepID=A0A811NH13_9POAL|nr:unnamed protein product [Miscanthus lutarioriparius]
MWRCSIPLGRAGEAAHLRRPRPPRHRPALSLVDVLSLGPRERRALLKRLVRVADEDNERFLLKLKARGADAGGGARIGAGFTWAVSARWNAK